MNDRLKEEIREAKRWDELVDKCRKAVGRYENPTLLWMSEMFGCSLDILQNIGDSVEGLAITGSGEQPTLRMISTATSQH